MEEIELIEKSQNGNKAALNELLKSNYSMLSKYVIKLTADESIAQDIVQETMLKAVVNINKYQPKGKFSTWLITIATNTFRDYLRKNKRFTDLDEELPSSSNMEENIISSIEYKDVLKILSSIPYEKRVTFILKHYYGYKYEEIAGILKCPVGTVRSRLNNSIKLIVERLKERGVYNV